MENPNLLTKNAVKNIIGQKLEKMQGDKKFKCQYCGQKFIKKKFLSSHLQIRHNMVEKTDLKSSFINVESKIKVKPKTKPVKPNVGGSLLQGVTDLDSLTEEDLIRLDASVEKMNKSMAKGSETLKTICETLMVELKYMICEYKTPFISF